MDRAGHVPTAAVALGVITCAHAVVVWPPRATIAFFVGGIAIAFTAEAIVIHLGWLDHHIGRGVLGVPVYVLFGWPGTIYVAFFLASMITDGLPAVVLTGLLTTGYDLLTDHRGVENGYWTYTDDVGGPRHRSVPWWNFTGWFLISCLTAGLATPFL